MNPIGMRIILTKVWALIDDPTLVVALATFFIALLTWYATVAKPRVRVYFWEPETGITTARAIPSGEPVTLRFLLRNLGDFLGLHNWAATLLTAYIYFPSDWKINEARRPESPEAKTFETFKASPSGYFANMQYIAVPSAYDPRPPTISIVSYLEDVICEVDVRIPPGAAGRRWTLFCQMTSREGDLGVHRLHVDAQGRDASPQEADASEV